MFYLIFFFILARVLCSAHQCVYTQNSYTLKHELSCKPMQSNPSNLTEFVQEIGLNESLNWVTILINNKNFPTLNKYLFENISVEYLDLTQNNIEWIEDDAFDRIKDLDRFRFIKESAN